MLNKMGGKNKYIPIKAKGGTNNKKRRKMGVTKKQQKQIAQMNELKKTGNPEVDEASQEVWALCKSKSCIFSLLD